MASFKGKCSHFRVQAEDFCQPFGLKTIFSRFDLFNNEVTLVLLLTCQILMVNEGGLLLLVSVLNECPGDQLDKLETQSIRHLHKL